MGFETLSTKPASNMNEGTMTAAVEKPPVPHDRKKKSAGAFLTISEVAGDLDVQQHVLRFWETKFSQIRPLKRGGGRRYYRPEDVALLKKIHELLYTQGYTIKGVQKLLRQNGKNAILSADFSAGADGMAKPAIHQTEAVNSEPSLSPDQFLILESALQDLIELRNLVSAD
jgi:DNA-binding transcriptional MerR regulator